MNSDIKDIRRKTGMSQAAFAKAYDIPLSTLRKWEQGISSPPDYVIKLILRSLPQEEGYEKIQGRDGNIYYYDPDKELVADTKGNSIMVREDLEGVKSNNLKLYISDLFEDFYDIQDKFERDCRYDKEEDINWI